jgi:uncharacterized protein (DUF1015 family)
MAKIAPFKAIIYNQKKIKDLSRVVSPPYDIISPGQQNRLHAAHPYNIVRIDFGKMLSGDNEKNNRYTRAKIFLQHWCKEKILIQDNLPAIYLYAQNYAFQRRNFVRWGIIARLRLEDDDSVLAHEKTSLHHRSDRLKLIKAIKANINPVFSLLSDDSGLISNLSCIYQNKRPFIDINFQGVRHRLWRIYDERWIRKIIKIFSTEKIFIADGHHRFEVSRAYQKYCRSRNPHHTGKEDYNCVMMYFSPLEDAALKILPIHRLFKKIPPNLETHLGKFFDIIACGKKEEIFSLMETAGSFRHLFGMYLGKRKFCVLRLKENLDLARLMKMNKPPSWKNLDVSILHALVVEKLFQSRNSDFKTIFYTQDCREAIRAVDAGNFKVAFFLNPTRPHQVREVALEGARMPHKSTYFYPKLLSGLVMNPVQNFSKKNFE